MQKRELVVLHQISRLGLEGMLNAWTEREDAQVRPMGRLVRSYKTEGENMHWYVTGLKKGKGTVDVTYTPSVGKLTVSVHDNRRGLWAGQVYLRLIREITKRTKETGKLRLLRSESLKPDQHSPHECTPRALTIGA